MFLFLTQVAAITLDLSNKQVVQNAARTIADNLMKYYDPPRTAGEGSIFPNSAKDASGFQWFEGGIMWSAMFEYIKTAGDARYVETITQALVLASFGRTASFLGEIPTLAETLQGKWNDDILWWGMGPLTGAELFGNEQVMPGGTTYLRLANTTYQQAWAQWDGECGGGVYWSRDRNNPRSRGFKSTITNAQILYVGSKLAALTRDNTYAQNAERTYRWMKERGIVDADYTVNDGTDRDRACAIFIDQHSYNAGNTLAGLAVLYNVTSNQYFLDEAHRMARAALTRFNNNNIITDPCEPNCPENQMSFKGTLVRGLGVLHEYTNDASIRQLIRNSLQTSMTAMLNTCNEQLECGNYWAEGRMRPSNVHYQMNAVELATAFLKTFDVGVVRNQVGRPTQAPPTETISPPKNGDIKSGAVTLLSLLGLLV